MSRRANWQWHLHLGDEAVTLAKLDNAIAKLENDLEAKKSFREEIIKRATARARKAGDKVKPWTFDLKIILED